MSTMTVKEMLSKFKPLFRSWFRLQIELEMNIHQLSAHLTSYPVKSTAVSLPFFSARFEIPTRRLRRVFLIHGWFHLHADTNVKAP
jgi:hypothetical protein